MFVSTLKMSLLCLCLVFLTTCCMSWPTAYRRPYNYNDIPQSLDSEFTVPLFANQWDIAQEPILDEPLNLDYYSEPQWSDIEVTFVFIFYFFISEIRLLNILNNNCFERKQCCFSSRSLSLISNLTCILYSSKLHVCVLRVVLN